MPRTLATFQRGLPLGVATPRSVSRLASRYKLACGSRYQSNSWATSTASPAPPAPRPHHEGVRGPAGSRTAVWSTAAGCRPAAWPRPPRSAVAADQGALVLGDRPADLQQQLIVGVL